MALASNLTTFSDVTDGAPLSPAYLSGKFGVLDDNINEINNVAVAGFQENFFSITSYGASPSVAAAINTASIQTAIHDAEAVGGTVFIPHGTYPIAGTTGENFALSVQSGVEIRGSGWGSILKLDTGAHVQAIRVSNVTSPPHGVAFRDFAIDGNGLGHKDAGLLQINNAESFLVDRMFIHGGGSATSGVGGCVATAGGSTFTGSRGVITNSLFTGNSKAGVNISTGAAAHVTTIGSATGAASVDILIGTGNFSVEGANTSTYGISTSGADSGTISIGTGTGVQTMNLATGATGAKTTNIGTGAIGNLLTIGSVTDASSLDLLVGTGNFTLEGNVASTYAISATGANTGTFTLAAGTGARVVNLATGGTGVKTVNIATGAIDNDVIIGTVTGTASLRLLTGTGNFSLDGAATTTYTMAATTTSGTIDIGGTAQTGTMTLGDSSGTNIVQIGSGEGATTVNIADGATNAKTVNINTGAVANTTTIGTVSSTATTTILAGTGGITMTGTIENVDAKFVVPTGIDINFNQSPVMETNVNTGGVPTGAGGDINLMTLQEGVQMEQFIIGTQTIIAPRMTATGLLTSLDLTSTDGVEYNFGAVRANSQHAFTIGTSPAFFMELAVNFADVSGLEPFLMGFRLVQANDADFTNYTDFVGYGTNDGVSPGDATIQTQLNTGGVTSTDTNDAWANAATHTLKVLVSAAGVVTFTFDGSPPTATQAFTFDNADVVVPFIHQVFNAAAPGAVNLVSMQIGFQ